MPVLNKVSVAQLKEATCVAAQLSAQAGGNSATDSESLAACSTGCGCGTARAGMQGRTCSHLELCVRRPSPRPRPLAERRSPRCAWPGATVTVCASKSWGGTVTSRVGIDRCQVLACHAHSTPASELKIQNLAAPRQLCKCTLQRSSPAPDFAAVARQRLPLLAHCSHQPSLSSLDALGRSI